MKKKSLSTGKKFLVATLFSISTIFLGILLGFFIKYLYLGIISNDNDTISASLIFLIFPFILGLIFTITLMILLHNYDKSKKEKNIKWYVDKFLLALTPVWITVAMVFFSFFNEEGEGLYLIFSIIIFLCIGILTTPNVVLYALNDMKNWQEIVTKNGNLANCKKAHGFYKMYPPVSFERKIYFAILKDQILNLHTVALVIIFFIVGALLSSSHQYAGIPGNIFYAILHTKSVRAEGYLFFGAVFFASFWIPIFAYYITNAIYKLRIVKRHEYIVYHAIVDEVDTYKIRIKNSGVHFKYDYCSCVGIKSKDVNKTKSILIFVPDDMLLFPDTEE